MPKSSWPPGPRGHPSPLQYSKWLSRSCVSGLQSWNPDRKSIPKQREEAKRKVPVPGGGLPVFSSSYPEMVTGFFFVLMTVLWFTREPGFVPGWDSFFEK